VIYEDPKFVVQQHKALIFPKKPLFYINEKRYDVHLIFQTIVLIMVIHENYYTLSLVFGGHPLKFFQSRTYN
jgi:hypothetical protein